MISADIEALAHRYCKAGVQVQYTNYPLSDHVIGIPLFEAEAIAFLQSRFNGVPMRGNCATLSPRSALKPLPLPPLPEVILGKVRRTKRGYALAARLDQDVAASVTVSFYAIRAGKRKRLATLRPRGELADEVTLDRAAAARRRVRARLRRRRQGGHRPGEDLRDAAVPGRANGLSDEPRATPSCVRSTRCCPASGQCPRRTPSRWRRPCLPVPRSP